MHVANTPSSDACGEMLPLWQSPLGIVAGGGIAAPGNGGPVTSDVIVNSTYLGNQKNWAGKGFSSTGAMIQARATASFGWVISTAIAWECYTDVAVCLRLLRMR